MSAPSNEVLAQVLANAKSELEYALHRLHAPSVVRYTVVRRNGPTGVVTAMRILESGPEGTKFNFAATASTAANLSGVNASAMRDVAEKLRSDDSGEFEVMPLMKYFEHRCAELRNLIATLEEITVKS